MDASNLGDGNSSFVPVVFSRDPKEADFYRSLLEDYGLEVRIDEEYNDREADSDEFEGSVRGIAVLVAPEHLAEAQAAIKHRMDEEEVEGDYDDEFYDDEEDKLDGLQEFDPGKDL